MIYLEITYLGNGDTEKRTDKGAGFNTMIEARESFDGAKAYEESTKTAAFFLNMRNHDGDIIETIGITGDGFTALTGEQPKSEAYYINLNKNYWKNFEIANEITCKEK